MNETVWVWIMLAVFFGLCAAAALFGATFKPGEWHGALVKPSWNPPNWVFAPVWSVLYIMIALAGWMVWNNAPWSPAMGLWAVQLGLNAAWSWLFFGLHRMDLAFYDITLLWLVIGAFIIAAWPITLLGAVLFVPYALWVSFAAVLNFSIWRLNS